MEKTEEVLLSLQLLHQLRGISAHSETSSLLAMAHQGSGTPPGPMWTHSRCFSLRRHSALVKTGIALLHSRLLRFMVGCLSWRLLSNSLESEMPLFYLQEANYPQLVANMCFSCSHTFLYESYSLYKLVCSEIIRSLYLPKACFLRGSYARCTSGPSCLDRPRPGQSCWLCYAL